ncbi:MAG: PQQ-binding-like beta-propeller repeat protein [Firmicutes bacterium]|nr:PQQ-binding-like beta-propeller repeat protein [Bacillota bacterium]
MKITVRQIALAGVLLAISAVLANTPLGMIPVPTPARYATIMHIPVIIVGILEGPVMGAIIGLLFGIIALLKVPEFGPAVHLIPRPLVGLIPALVYGGMTYILGKFNKTAKDSAAVGVAAAVGSLVNTAGVLGMAVLVMPDLMSPAMALTIGLTNGIPEAILSVIVTVPVVMALKRKFAHQFTAILLVLFFFTGCSHKIEPFHVVYTNNLQGNALPSGVEPVSPQNPSAHFSQVMEIMKKSESGEKTQRILLDAGNSLSGFDDFSSSFNGAPMIALFKMAGYDAVVMSGDRGIDYSKLPSEPFILKSCTPDNVSCIVKEINGTKVGIYTTEQNEGVSDENIIKAVDEHIKKNKPDYSILICRNEDPEIAALSSKEIDLIIPGRYDDTLKKDEITNIGKKQVAPWVDSRFAMVRIDVSADKKVSCRLIPISGADFQPSGEVISVLTPYINEFKSKYPENYASVISSNTGFSSDLLHPGKDAGESESADFIADVMMETTGAQVAVINHLAVRKRFGGVVSIAGIKDALPFENEIVTIDLKGSVIEEILQSNAVPGHVFYQVGGLTLGIKPPEGDKQERKKPEAPTEAASEKRVLVYYKDKPIEPEKTYRVATIDYLVNSEKEKYSAFKNAPAAKFTGIYLNHAVLDYISKHPFIPPVSQRMLVDDACDATMLKKFCEEQKQKKELSETEKTLAEGLSEMGIKKYDASAGILEKAINGDNPAAGLFSVTVLIRSGKLSEAVLLMKKVIKAYPDDSDIQKTASSLPLNNPEHSAGSGKIVWQTFKGDFTRTGRSIYAGKTTAKPAWKFRTYHSVQSSPAIGSDGIIYCASGDGSLYAINPQGTKKWDVKLGKVLLASPAISSKGLIYQGSDDGNLYTVSTSGKIIRKYYAGGWIKSTAAVDSHENVYFGTEKGLFCCLDAKGKVKWTFKTGGEVFSSVCICKDGRIVFGSNDSNIYCLTPQGKLSWKYATGGKVFSTPAISDNGTIYSGSDDGHVYAISPEGKLKWKYKTGGFVPSSPAIGKNGEIIIGSEDNNLYALTPQGKVIWKFKTGYEIFGSPAVDREGNIFFGSDDTFFYILSPTGELLSKCQASKYIESSPAIGTDGSVYFGSDDGYIYCIR